MCKKNNDNTKRPFVVFLYDRTETGDKSDGIIAAEVSARYFPYVHIGGIYIDRLTTGGTRPAFDELMNDCDNMVVDCIAVPSEKCLLGDIDLTLGTYKSFAERGIDVLELETGKFLNYEEIWDGLVTFAESILDVERR